MRTPAPPPQRMCGDVPTDSQPFRRSTVDIAMLTPMQRRAVRARALAVSYESAADALGMSDHTVRNLVWDAIKRVGVHSLLELLAALGWLRVPPDEQG